MASQKSEKYSRIMYLLSFGCTKVTRSYIMKHVRDTSPSGHNPSPWTLDDVLKHNKLLIDNTYFGSRRETQRRLFPQNGGATDILSWDLQLLCFVFLELCNPSLIVQMDYDHFKTIRNRLCHTANGMLSDSDYSVCMVHLTSGIRRALTEIQDPDLTTEMEEAITAVETDAALQMERFMETELKNWHTSERAALARVETGLGRVEEGMNQTTEGLKKLSEGKSMLDLVFTQKCNYGHLY